MYHFSTLTGMITLYTLCHFKNFDSYARVDLSIFSADGKDRSFPQVVLVGITGTCMNKRDGVVIKRGIS